MIVARFAVAFSISLPFIAATAATPDTPSFTNVTAAAGLTGANGFRSSVADINGDGYPDLVFHRQSYYASADVLNKQDVYLNVPGANPSDPHSRRFQVYTTESGIRATRAGSSSGHSSDGVIFADVDNDGDLDAFFIVYVHDQYSLNLGKNELMLNDGQGHFTYSPSSPFHTEPIYNTTDGVWLDIENDGKIDLFIGNYYWNNQPTREQLYRGGGDGSFTNVTTSSGIGARTNVVYAVSNFDWNGDGFMDLYAPVYDYLNSALACLHWRNNGNGTFTQVQVSTNYDDNRGFLSGVASFGSMPRDYDNDGDMDFLEILVHGGTQRGKFSGPVRNDGGVFSWDWSRVKNRGSEDPDTGHDGDHQASWFDYDGDMLSDYVITESFYANSNRLFLFRQATDHTFSPVTNGSGLEAINTMNKGVYDVIPLDYDRDGDEDLLVAFAEDGVDVQLWRNDVGNLNHWISIDLAGEAGSAGANRAGIGARIEVTAGGMTQTREVAAGIGQHAPQAPLTQTIGLGSATVIDSIRVRWPNAARSVSERLGVAVDQHLTVHEVCSTPADPAGLTVSRTGADVDLSWNDPLVRGLNWNLYRGVVPNPSGWGAPIQANVRDSDLVAPGIQRRDAGAAAGATSYFYLASAVNDCAESAPHP